MIRAIVTDIEGTTSSLRFVHDVLFPYARAHIADFVRCNAEDPRVVPYLNDVPALSSTWMASSHSSSPGSMRTRRSRRSRPCRA